MKGTIVTMKHQEQLFSSNAPLSCLLSVLLLLVSAAPNIHLRQMHLSLSVLLLAPSSSPFHLSLHSLLLPSLSRQLEAVERSLVAAAARQGFPLERVTTAKAVELGGWAAAISRLELRVRGGEVKVTSERWQCGVCCVLT